MLSQTDRTPCRGLSFFHRQSDASLMADTSLCNMNILAIGIIIMTNLNRELGSVISWCSGEVMHISFWWTWVQSSVRTIFPNSFNFCLIFLGSFWKIILDTFLSFKRLALGLELGLRRWRRVCNMCPTISDASDCLRKNICDVVTIRIRYRHWQQEQNDQQNKRKDNVKKKENKKKNKDCRYGMLLITNHIYFIFLHCPHLCRYTSSCFSFCLEERLKGSTYTM